ncbi:MAG: cellulase family glycosylhydrolase [Pseudomonadota bacterium]
MARARSGRAYAGKVCARSGICRLLFALAAVAIVCLQSPLARADRPRLGIGVHLHGKSRGVIDRQLQLAADAGATIIRWDAPWAAVEREVGHYSVFSTWDYIVDRARALGMESLIILDYGNPLYDRGGKPTSQAAVAGFAAYAKFMVAHFKDRVPYFQIWNEWNGHAGKTKPGTLDGYLRLERATCEQVKSVSSSAQFVVGSFSTTAYNSLLAVDKRETLFDQYLRSPPTQCADVLALHPYDVYRRGALSPPKGFGEILSATSSAIRAHQCLRKRPIFITEIGWSTASNSPFGVSETIQAALLKRAILAAEQRGVAALFIYTLLDGPDKNSTEDNFGIYRIDGTAKPAVAMLQAMSRATAATPTRN